MQAKHTNREKQMPSQPSETETRRDWEVIQQNGSTDITEQLKIKGGYLYRTTVNGKSSNVVFVPGE